ncbi:restriction endonuclease [Luteimonas huabeiensis]|uniref:restriction endonuclease n=1 Tax=Luteimonas huabeiensis TaxID=1244513 RepID=UPI00046697F3|nr:restriction endonuclease [Luteimonas huabeiensis]
MNAIWQWAIAATVALALGGAATAYLQRVRRPRDETAAGIRALAAMSWREFIHLVLDAMARRGFVRVVDHDLALGDQDYTLEREGGRWLLSCKHGSAFVIGRPSVDELADAMRLARADGGFLLTQGRIVDEARAAARAQRIELLDGRALWPELRDLVRPELREAIRRGAAGRARTRSLLAWLLALLAGVATFLVLTETTAPPAGPPAPRAGGVAPPPAPASPQAQDASAGGDAPLAAEDQRRAVLRALRALPRVGDAAWTSHSTLEVRLTDAGGDAFDELCPLIARYPDVATSRIQLTPPPGSGVQVRFRQCRSH